MLDWLQWVSVPPHPPEHLLLFVPDLWLHEECHIVLYITNYSTCYLWNIPPVWATELIVTIFLHYIDHRLKTNLGNQEDSCWCSGGTTWLLVYCWLHIFSSGFFVLCKWTWFIKEKVFFGFYKKDLKIKPGSVPTNVKYLINTLIILIFAVTP